MKNLKPLSFNTILIFLVFSCIFFGCNTRQKTSVEFEENEEYDGPDKAADFQAKRTKDPALGYVPRERLMKAIEQTEESKILSTRFISAFGTWTERGPNSDAVGPSSGNTRANSGIASVADLELYW